MKKWTLSAITAVVGYLFGSIIPIETVKYYAIGYHDVVKLTREKPTASFHLPTVHNSIQLTFAPQKSTFDVNWKGANPQSSGVMATPDDLGLRQIQGNLGRVISLTFKETEEANGTICVSIMLPNIFRSDALLPPKKCPST